MPTTIPSTTSSTRPGSPSTGDAYFETDTKRYIIYDGANWRQYYYDSSLDPSLAASQLSYTGGIYTTSNYTISVQPKMHFDAAILDGSDSLNNPGDGVAVSTWGDRSGQAVNYEASQATGSLQPTFNISGDDKYVSFDGGDVLGLANSISRSSTQSWTTIQVGNAFSSSSIYHSAPNVGSSYGSVQSGVYSDGNIYVRGSSIASGKDYSALNVFTLTRNSSNTVEAFRDGNNSEGSRTTADTFVFDSIGPSGGTKTKGNIYECLLFDSILSSTDLNTISSYLANKYSGLPTLNSW